MMPKMDGISATRSIRQYDALTPIISMTSNFSDSDIMQYIGSGMTDILPKPFSRRTLYQMLEKHCAHLKTMQREQVLDQASFPLAPYPYPVTMNSTVNGDMDNVTFWPQQPQFDQPPAIIPDSDGKFIWAVPDIIKDVYIQENKKARLDQL
jgi:osomolarity two-component system response regulator SKN7